MRLDLTMPVLVFLGKTCVGLNTIASRIEAVQKIALLVYLLGRLLPVPDSSRPQALLYSIAARRGDNMTPRQRGECTVIRLHLSGSSQAVHWLPQSQAAPSTLTRARRAPFSS